MVSPSTSEFPGFHNLFSLSWNGSERHFVADVDFGRANPVDVLRGTVSIDIAEAAWMMGARRPEPVIWSGEVGPILVDASILDEFREAGVTGWETYAVSLRGKGGELIPGYMGLIVKGRCGPLQPERSRVVPKEFPGGICQVREGLVFDEDSWDGSDIFMPADGTAFVFVTERVGLVFSRRAKNVRCVRLAEFEQIVFDV